MLPAIEKLLAIQERDRALLQLRAEQQRIPQELQNLQVRLQEEFAGLESLRSRAKQIEADRKKLELDAESKRAMIVKYRLQQNQVKKNEEYQALTREIEHAEAEIRHIEDQELDLMELADQLQRQIRQEQARLAELTSLTQQKKDELEKRAATVEQQLVTIEAERVALAEQIDPALLSRYQRIWDKRRDYAIVRVEHDSCGGCHLKLPPQTIHFAKSGKDLVACDFCGRLLC